MTLERYSSELWFKEAVALATRAHANQVDKAGEPYIGHLIRTAAHLVRLFPDATPAEIQAAILHDVLEDTGTIEPDLAAAGIEPEVVAMVRDLTRPAGVTDYKDWIHWLTNHASTGALRVKLADNTDNRDPERCRKADMRTEMTNKYERAAHVLQGALEWRAAHVGDARAEHQAPTSEPT